MTRNGQLLIVGSIAFDSVETPAGKVEEVMGGAAVYASLAASYFTQPYVVGIVGQDYLDEHIAVMKNRGIDVRGIEQAPGETFRWAGRYRANFKERDTLTTCLNVFEDFDPKLPEDYKACTNIFLGNIDPVLQSRVLDQMGDTTLVGIDTMNFWIRNSLDALLAVIGRADILFINDEEALELSEKDTILNAAEAILELGPRYLVIKRGEYGALLFGDGVRRFVPAVLLPRVVDPTGAGDAFAGGFCGYAAAHDSIDSQTLANALLTGTALASFSVEDFSVDRLTGLTPQDLSGRLAQLETMMSL